MHIDATTFTDYTGADKVLKLLKTALKNISGNPDRQGKYKVPNKLHKLAKPTKRGEPGRLLSKYRDIWKSCYIIFSRNERGASILLSKGEIRFGPFFIRGWTGRDIEKVILHEYFHKAIMLQPDYGSSQFRKEVQHSEIDHIITYELKYPGDPRGSKMAVD